MFMLIDSSYVKNAVCATQECLQLNIKGMLICLKKWICVY